MDFSVKAQFCETNLAGSDLVSSLFDSSFLLACTKMRIKSEADRKRKGRDWKI